MTVKEFNEKFAEIKENATSHHGTTSYDYYEDPRGYSAGSYDGGFYKKILMGDKVYTCETDYNGNSKISEKSLDK